MKRAPETKDELLERMQFKLAGPYIAYKRNTDDYIKLKKIISEENDNPKAPIKELCVELKNMFIDD